jgi:hypothetical protein
LLALTINMMVGVQDIAALLPDEVGDVTHQSLAVGTLDEQSRSLSGFGHGRRGALPN